MSGIGTPIPNDASSITLLKGKMIMRKLSILLLAIFLLSVPAFSAAAQAPDSCPGQPNIFPRYDRNHQRLVLVDWTTGAEVRVLGEGLGETRIVNWSPDCRYLVTATGVGNDIDTSIWNTVTAERIGIVEDARRIPHHVTWSPDSSSVVVEGRTGAFLWYLETGQQLQLTIDGYMDGRSFRTISWNYPAGTLDTLSRSVGNPVTFSLQTGRPTNLNLAEGEYPGSFYPGTVLAPSGDFPYTCRRGASWALLVGARLIYSSSHRRLAFVDSTDIQRVVLLVEDDLDLLGGRTQEFGLSQDCRHIFGALRTDQPYHRTGVIWGVGAEERIQTIEDVANFANYEAYRVAPRSSWSPDARYLLVQTYRGAVLWDSADNQTILLTTFANDWGYNFHSIEWDLAANQLLAVGIDAPDTTVTFDLTTGARR
jgi:WD40 repeat protein